MLPLGHAGRWVTDATGRVVIVHGINMVYKLPPYYPAAAGFGNDDAAFLQSVGFNAVRVGVIWKAVEPEPGVYDDGYLNRIAQTVATLARHGIVSLLDFHQDLLNELFQGEGVPDWAVQSRRPTQPGARFPCQLPVEPCARARARRVLRRRPRTRRHRPAGPVRGGLDARRGAVRRRQGGARR